MTPAPRTPIPGGRDVAPSNTVCLTEDVVGTTDAAHRVGVDPAQFSKWAKRRGLAPSTHVRVGRSWFAVWSLTEVLDADARGPVARTRRN